MYKKIVLIYLRFLLMKYLVLVIVYCMTIICMSIDIVHVDTVLSICTDIEIKASTMPNYVPNRIYDCLVRGNLFLISQEEIENKILNETIMYQSALDNYDKIFYQSAQNNVEKRDKLRSIQRDIVTLTLRLKHFSGLFNIPSFINLSDERRLRKIEEYVSGLRDTYTYVSTLPPVLIDFMDQTEKIVSASVNVDNALIVQERESLRFQKAMTELRNLIRVLYV